MELLRAENIQKVYNTRAGGKPCRALAGVSFSIEAGEFVAIMGASGSGKSTLLNILATLDTPTSGEVYLEGQSMKQIKGKDLAAFRREKLGFVFQDFNLLDTFTVRDNILLPLVLSRTPLAEMERRLKPVVASLGIEPLLEHFPVEISGGEKQRISIARAMLKDAPIVILDEATASIDPENEHLIQEAISALTHGKTIITIAHRLATIENADQILVIDGGTVAQRGTHKELLQQEGTYKKFIQIREQAEGWRIQ